MKLPTEQERRETIADARSLAAQQALQTTVDEEEVEPREAQTLEDQSQVLESEDDVVAQVLREETISLQEAAERERAIVEEQWNASINFGATTDLLLYRCNC